VLFGIVFSFAAVHAPELFGLAGNVRNGSLSFHQHLVQVLLQAALLYTVSSDALPGLTHRLWLRRTKTLHFHNMQQCFHILPHRQLQARQAPGHPCQTVKLCAAT